MASANSASDDGRGRGEGGDFLAAWRLNPFFVLGLPPTATPAEIERTGQRLLGLLAVGSTSVAECDTPLGPITRDADTVRSALAALRDPAQRLQHALWADVAPPALADGAQAGDGGSPDRDSQPLHLRLLGWHWGL